MAFGIGRLGWRDDAPYPAWLDYFRAVLSRSAIAFPVKLGHKDRNKFNLSARQD